MVNIKLESDPQKEFCSDPNCRDYGKRGVGNIVRYGHDKDGRQRLKCKTCGSVFVETKNTVFYNRKLSEDQIILISKLLVEKNGIRAIKRIMEIHRDTISDVVEDLARHAREVADFLIRNVGLTKVQVDEMWSFVKIPTKDEKATFASDGNDQYTSAILENFDAEMINYGQLVNVKERERGRVVGKTRTIIFGEVGDESIDTIYVERSNLTVRLGISRLVRKSLCFSKCKEMLDNHLDVYQCYNNMIRVNSALTIETEKGEKNIVRTPCIAEGITDHIWTWEELLIF